MKKKHGFTLVEFIIVITVIGIISGMTTLSFIKVQADAKDSQRANQVRIVSEALEKYYVKNGEYPSCNAMAGSATSVASLLGIESSVLKTPTATSGSNSIIAACGNLSVGVDGFGYVGNASCIASPATACTGYTLKYRNENANSVISLNSRHGSTNQTISSISAISGSTTTIGSTLTVGTLDPTDATASYQWQSATTAGGTYTNIGGATGGTYVLTLYELGKYLKVVATGTGSYTGTATSAATTQVTDANWITIGTQTWGKYNLNVGTRINAATAQTNNATLEKYCYNDTESNCTSYGGLYQWDETMQYVTTEGAQGICPINSRIPTDNDWKILEVQLGMTQIAADTTGWRGTDQGIQLKTGGASGLNIPLAGYSTNAGLFYVMLSRADLWSSSEFSGSAWLRELDSGSNNWVYRNYNNKVNGYSVRCVVSQQTPITAIASTTGATSSVGSILTAGALTPGAATVVYQWQNATTAGGAYTNIAGATGSTYTLKASDVGKYIKVVATGTGMYTGTATSAASAQVTDTNWIAVGTQVWAKTNLNVGSMLYIYQTSTNNATTEKYCYDNQAANCTSYGGLYQWDEAMQYVTTAGAQGLCPAGSHIPTTAEWSTLLTLVSVANLRTGGTSGFDALLAGFGIIASQQFLSLGSVGYYWSSSDAGSGNATDVILNGYYNTYSTADQAKVQANSIRCIAN